jgi:hypothetical protein
MPNARNLGTTTALLALLVPFAPALADEAAPPPTEAAAPAPVDEGMGLAAGLRIDLLCASSYDNPGTDVDGEFGAGFGLLADYALLDFLKVGFDFHVYTVKAEHASDRDVAIHLGPRVIGTYAFRDLGPVTSLSPYAYLAFGYSHFVPDQGDSAPGMWLTGGLGAEAYFGHFGAFLELSYGGGIYTPDQGDFGDLRFHGFGIGLGAKYRF